MRDFFGFDRVDTYVCYQRGLHSHLKLINERVADLDVFCLFLVFLEGGCSLEFGNVLKCMK